VICQIGAKECLMHVEKGNYDHKKIQDILTSSDVILTERKKSDYKAEDIEQDLENLLADGVKKNMGLYEFVL
jgi:hypothetical protein